LTVIGDAAHCRHLEWSCSRMISEVVDACVQLSQSGGGGVGVVVNPALVESSNAASPAAGRLCPQPLARRAIAARCMAGAERQRKPASSTTIRRRPGTRAPTHSHRPLAAPATSRAQWRRANPRGVARTSATVQAACDARFHAQSRAMRFVGEPRSKCSRDEHVWPSPGRFAQRACGANSTGRVASEITRPS
jgi:hypothetical protein